MMRYWSYVDIAIVMVAAAAIFALVIGTFLIRVLFKARRDFEVARHDSYSIAAEFEHAFRREDG